VHGVSFVHIAKTSDKNKATVKCDGKKATVRVEENTQGNTEDVYRIS